MKVITVTILIASLVLCYVNTQRVVKEKVENPAEKPKLDVKPTTTPQPTTRTTTEANDPRWLSLPKEEKCKNSK